ncbi:unnamed protein product [Urochloa humidicola]
MQQQQQPGMPPFAPAAGTPPVGVGQHGAATAAAPISSRPPEGQQAEEVGEQEGMSSSGNRWPRQETLALLKIRSEMDAAFREAALKGPLWDQVSRRLEAMGYKRSAKKCREKFENVDKYYKRTKDGRAGRGDGKAYRFFSELEALHGGAPASSAPPPAAVHQLAPAIPLSPKPQPPPAAVPQPQPPPAPMSGSDAACMMTAGDMSCFSSGSDDDDGEDTTEDTGAGKRKRHGGDSGGGGKMMRFLEGLMRQVMERQEEMQQRFMEAMERREQERMIREEAWRRQEVARLAREQDALAQERAMAASRDAAVVSFIQRVTGQAIPMPPSVSSVISPPPPLQPTPVASAAPAPAIQQSPKPQHTMPPNKAAAAAQPQQQQQQTPPPEETHPHHRGGGGGQDSTASPSRWPKAEVHALIQLRTELEARYQDSGPKGPLWEDISAGMRRLGYGRSAKRCKEKWENINKYFKKVKESNKKRPEDSKTCPYYHQLDALYRTKARAGGGAAPPPPPAGVTVLAAVPLSSQTPPHATTTTSNGGGGGGSGVMMQTTNNNGGNVAAATGNGNGNGNGNGVAANNKQAAEGATNKETAAAAMEPTTRPQPVSMNDSYVNDTVDSTDSSMDDDDDDGDDEDDMDGGGGNSKMQQQYEIQLQRQRQQQGPNASAGAGAATTTSGSFLTMVHH